MEQKIRRTNNAININKGRKYINTLCGTRDKWIDKGACLTFHATVWYHSTVVIDIPSHLINGKDSQKIELEIKQKTIQRESRNAVSFKYIYKFKKILIGQLYKMAPQVTFYILKLG